MEIIFIGLLYSPEDEQRILKKSKTGIQGSANNYQWGIIKGFFQNTQNKITVINSVPMGSFPKHCKIFIEKKQKYECDSVEILSDGYINLPLIKQVQREKNVYRQLKKFLKAKENPSVIVYSLYNPYLQALKKLKRHYKKFNYILIITDLPCEFGATSNKGLSGCIKDWIGRRDLELAKYADGYVLLTERMKDVVDLQGKPYALIEGISRYKTEDLLEVKDKATDLFILYTGALDRQFGLGTLIEAFKLLPKGNVRLLIAGSGAYEKELQKECETDSNIQYLGYLSNEEIIKLQNRAAILVNPRSPEKEYTVYSFPSKTMEYLASGTPVVMYALKGVPEAYYKYLFIPEDDSPEAMAKTFNKILAMDNVDIKRHCENARRFILQEKSCKVQTKKIIDLIEKLNATENLT